LDFLGDFVLEILLKFFLRSCAGVESSANCRSAQLFAGLPESLHTTAKLPAGVDLLAGHFSFF
jgi:hypothetical protein